MRWAVHVLLFGLGCSQLTDPLESGVGGLDICVESAEGQPVADAEVWILNQYAGTARQTSQEGTASFAGLATGPVTLVVMAGAQGGAVATEVIRGHARKLPCVRLAPLTCIGGRFRLDNGGVAPPMEILWSDTGRWTWSRADGRFEFMVPAGITYELTARAINMVDKKWLVPAVPGVGAGCGHTSAPVEVAWAEEAEERVPVILPDLPHPVGDAAVALDGTQFYVTGGKSCTSTLSSQCPQFNNSHVDHLQIFDFGAGTWRSGPSLPSARSAARAGILNDQLVVVGGMRSGSRGCEEQHILEPGVPCFWACKNCFMSKTFSYDPLSGVWSDDKFPPMPFGVAWGTLVQAPEALFYVGGITSNAVGYTARVHTLSGTISWAEVSGGLVQETYFSKACLLGHEIFVYGGASWREAALQSQVPDACGRIINTLDFRTSGWHRSYAPSPIVHEGAAYNCVANGKFIYDIRFSCDRPEGLRFQPELNRWTNEPPFVALGASSLGPAVATPHGAVMAGSGQPHTSHHNRAFAVVGRRFLDGPSAQYIENYPYLGDYDAVCPGPVEPYVDVWSDPATALRECGQKNGCYEPCTEHADCFMGYFCNREKLCTPNECRNCDERCELRDIIQAEVYGRLINLCLTIRCI